jgi:rhomboid family GlyGly-CTERM serine protease
VISRAAWPLACALLAAAAAGFGVGADGARDWQPSLALSEPWRAFSAAFVHYSPAHLGANLAGCAVLAFFGWAARVPAVALCVWGLAWPLGHALLGLVPAIAHYGGLSGLLHAGVAVACVFSLAAAQPRADEALSPALERQRLVAAIVWAGLWLKVLMEAPWGEPVRQVQGWDIAVVPLAHATGAACGSLLALAWVWRWPQAARPKEADTAPAGASKRRPMQPR